MSLRWRTLGLWCWAAWRYANWAVRAALPRSSRQTTKITRTVACRRTDLSAALSISRGWRSPLLWLTANCPAKLPLCHKTPCIAPTTSFAVWTPHLCALCRYSAPIDLLANEPVAFVEQKRTGLETTNQIIGIDSASKMANNPSIKDNPFKRLDALRTKVSGVKAPVPAEGSGVGHPGGKGDDRGRPTNNNRAREEEGLHVLVAPVADGRAEAEDLQAAEEALSTSTYINS